MINKDPSMLSIQRFHSKYWSCWFTNIKGHKSAGEDQANGGAMKGTGSVVVSEGVKGNKQEAGGGGENDSPPLGAGAVSTPGLRKCRACTLCSPKTSLCPAMLCKLSPGLGSRERGCCCCAGVSQPPQRHFKCTAKLCRSGHPLERSLGLPEPARSHWVTVVWGGYFKMGSSGTLVLKE